MAKHKTKHQKIMAELRQLKKKVEQQIPEGVETPLTVKSTDAPEVKSEETRSRFSFKIPEKVTSVPALSATTYSYDYVYSDLRKIAILASLAIALEVVLSLIMSQGYEQQILKFFKLS